MITHRPVDIVIVIEDAENGFVIQSKQNFQMYVAKNVEEAGTIISNILNDYIEAKEKLKTVISK